MSLHKLHGLWQPFSPFGAGTVLNEFGLSDGSALLLAAEE